jgi:hypothetical protein
MEEHFVWMTTRRIKPGTLADFERAWRPDPYPTGLRRAYAYWSADGRRWLASRSGTHVSRVTLGAHPKRRRVGARRWALTSLRSGRAFHYGRELAGPCGGRTWPVRVPCLP